MNEATTSVSTNNESMSRIAWIVYGLYGVGLIFTAGFLSLVGLIIAHVKVSDATGTIYHSHLRNQIRSAWIAFAVMTVGAILSPFLIGIPIMIFGAIWFIYRIIKGALKLNDGQPYPGL